MPEPGIRDVVGSGASNPRARSSVAEAAGDSMASTTCPHQEIFRNSNKHKIPRSAHAYDSENPLIGLCDVWFDEIKPYLVRNNIKLHVNCSSAGGDHQHKGAAGASPCFDPGAALDNPPRTALYAGSSAPPDARTPRRIPTAERTPSRRPLSPMQSVPQTPQDGTPVQPHNNEQKIVEQPRSRRRRRRRAQPETSWRVPRLCRAFTVLCAGSHAVKITSHPPNDDFEQAPSVSRGQSVQPSYRHPSPRRAESPLTHTASSNGSVSPSPILPPHIICRPKGTQALAAEMPPLLLDDIIDIIAECNEKRAKTTMYSSSEKNDCNSSCTYLTEPSRQEKPDVKKLPPWK